MSKKGKREERLVRGDEILEDRDVDLDAPDAVLLPALVAAKGIHPDGDLSIADWLGSIATEESARQLREWDASAPPDKDLRRIIRASLFRLQQKGIASAARAHADPEPVRLFDPVEPTGYLSPLDAAGNRLACLARQRSEGGQLVLYTLINDRTGMRRLHELHATKAQLREILAGHTHDAPMVPAPALYVDWLMQSAYRRGAPRDEEGGGYPLARGQFYGAPSRPMENPVGSMLAALSSTAASLAEDDSRLLEDSSALFEEPEMRSWAVTDDLVKVHQARFRDAQDTTLVLSQQQILERLNTIVEEAHEELFASEVRALYAGRLAEMALWFLLADASGRRALAARRCFALHQALADPSRRLKGIPFLRGLVFRAFAHLLPKAPEGEAAPQRDPASLIVPP